MKLPQRICVYPKDVQLITGRSYRFACRYLVKIKRHYQKLPEQFVTLEEFSAYTGISKDEILEVLK